MKIKSICEDGITFDNGSMLTHYHNQDCCEAVYADWGNMIAMTESEGNELKLSDYDFFDNILDSVVPIKRLGFYLVTMQGLCIRVDCYDIQNGYYSSNLELCHTSGKENKTYKNISETVQSTEFLD